MMTNFKFFGTSITNSAEELLSKNREIVGEKEVGIFIE